MSISNPVSSHFECVFCKSAQNPTKEDVISTWMTKVLPRLPKGAHVRFNSGRHQAGKTPTYIPGRRRQTFAAFEVENVCGSCNNDWMSQIEQAVRPVVKDMLLGKTATLDPNYQETIARWLALKFMVADAHPERGMQRLTEGQRSNFMATQTPPTGIEILIGCYNGKLPVLHQAWGSTNEPVIRYFIFGRFIGLVMYSDSGDAAGEIPGPIGPSIDLATGNITLVGFDDQHPHLQNIWPPTTPMLQWPEYACDDTDFIETVLPAKLQMTPGFAEIKTTFTKALEAFK